MIRVVLDANVFVSGVLVAKGNPARILEAWRRGEIDLVAAPDVLDEVGRVLRYPRLRKRHQWGDDEIDTFLARVRASAIVTPGLIVVQAVLDDPTDDKYLACATEGNADFIVSGDTHLLRLHPWQGIAIVTPANFIAVAMTDQTSESTDPTD